MSAANAITKPFAAAAGDGHTPTAATIWPKTPAASLEKEQRNDAQQMSVFQQPVWGVAPIPFLSYRKLFLMNSKARER